MSNSIINAVTTSHSLPADSEEMIVLVEEKRLQCNLEVCNLPGERFQRRKMGNYTIQPGDIMGLVLSKCCKEYAT